MRYANGQLEFVEQDLEANGFALPWGHTRSYANVLSNNATGINGNSWLVTQLQALLFVGVSYGNSNPAQICIVTGANSSRWFVRDASSSSSSSTSSSSSSSPAGRYRPQFSGNDVLQHDALAHEFTWTEAQGRRTVFYDNSTSQPPALAGKLKAIIDQAGRVVEVTYDGAGRLVKIEQEANDQTSGFYYEYVSNGGYGGLLASVTLKVNGVPVRRAIYTYYQGGSGGNVADLKSVALAQYQPATHSWSEFDRKHYRYYLSGQAGGFQHGLKFAIRGAAYQTMLAAGLNPENAPEAELANYADFYFEYDGEQRVTVEEIEGGRKRYTLSYEPNPANPPFSAVNTWAMRTIETLPDGNQNRVYSSQAGLTLLTIFRETATGAEWYDYLEYDSRFNQVLEASSYAVASVVEPSSGDPTLTVTLKANEGLIRENVYYTTTDPNTGAVAGWLEKTTVKKGASGTPVTQQKFEYETQEAFGEAIYPLRAAEVYPEESGSNPARTEYAYTWYEDNGEPTFQVQDQVVTRPAVPTSQNGSGVAGEERQVFDIYGQVTWQMDARGAITYRAYDLATGALVQQIEDVDTSRMSDVPSGWQTVAGWGLHLITDYLNDGLGRVVQARGPWHEVQLREKDTTVTSIRRVQFSAYLDEAHEVRRATGYMTGEEPTADFQIVGAVSLTRTDASGRVTDEIQAVRTCTCGPLTTEETFPQEKWSRWSHSIYDTWGRLYAQRVYHRIPAQGEGEEGANYLETIYGYDGMGRQNQVIEPSWTIRRIVYNSRGLAISNWTGTDDRGATDVDPTGGGAAGNDMKLVTAQEYDNGFSGADGNLTQVTQPVDSNSANDRIVTYGYDYRDRLDTMTQTDGTTTWITKTAYDNLDRPLQNTKYHSSVADGNRISRERLFYDLLGRLYKQETDGVDPANGNITGTLSSQNWYDLGGNLIKASPSGATSFTKTVFDALNRPTAIYTACVPGTAGVPAGDDNDVTSDTVLEQNETAYDRGGNTILATRRQRFDDATGTGALQDVATQPKARVSYVATWPDAIGRVRVSADYGTNGSAPLVRPAVAPARSDIVLVTSNRYKDNGDANATIDPMGLETRWENDQAGRRIKLLENYVEGCPERSRISEYGWHPSGQLQRLTLLNSDTGDQVTQWVYGTTLFDSAVADNNLLRAKIYPESDDRPAGRDAGPDDAYARLEYTANRQGQTVTFTDADGTVHTYAYDKLGRLINDEATTLNPSLDGAVRRLGRSYEVRGMLAKVTSYDAVSSVVNEVALAYDAFGNLIRDRQSHSGAVSAGTPEVGYSYANGSANTVRRTALTYPNGQVLDTQYGSANSVDDHFNRITALQLAGAGTTLVDYSYVGVAWQVRVGYAQPAVELTYFKQGSKPVGDAGDPYNGYDRFGRSVDLRWQKTTSGKAQLDRLQYGFDRDSRRTWRQRPLTTGEDNAYGYDGLSQVTQATLGNLNLNATAISAVPAQEEAWDYDPTGNWRGYRTKAAGALTLDQHRVHDKGNRLTQIEGNPNPILLDRVGRMRLTPPDAAGQWNTARVLIWDAWSRLVEIKETPEDGGDTIARYAYDGLTRRITRTTGGVTSHSYYSEAWRPLEERQDSETTAALHYYWGVRHRDDLVRRDRATTSGGALDETRYVLMDYYSPASLTDETGAVTERYRFSAFGLRTIMDADWAPIPDSECAFEFAFQGQFLDPESGLLNYGYRYYSPGLGRWLSKDPIEEKGGLNLYGFVENKAVNQYDTLGLQIGVEYQDLSDLRLPEDPISCASRIFNEVAATPARMMGSHDQHCLASCRIKKECIGGKFTAWAAGTRQDPPWQTDRDSNRDRVANQIGRNCPKNRSCEEQCAGIR